MAYINKIETNWGWQLQLLIALLCVPIMLITPVYASPGLSSQCEVLITAIPNIDSIIVQVEQTASYKILWYTLPILFALGAIIVALISKKPSVIIGAIFIAIIGITIVTVLLQVQW